MRDHDVKKKTLKILEALTIVRKPPLPQGQGGLVP